MLLSIASILQYTVCLLLHFFNQSLQTKTYICNNTHSLLTNILTYRTQDAAELLHEDLVRVSLSSLVCNVDNRMLYPCIVDI